MFFLQSAPKASSVQNLGSKAVENFKQIFLTPTLTEEERWDLYYDYSAVTEKVSH
ncbi:hypothetical protein VVR12_04965 [Rothia sp. LK2588]|uniref:hypothetical protein n=1 Tax=Rothia sp. LK2588 TaxID=3114369 RepID=UPI0034CD7F71